MVLTVLHGNGIVTPTRSNPEQSENYVVFCKSHMQGGNAQGWNRLKVERATPGKEVLGSIPAVAARYLLVWSLSV